MDVKGQILIESKITKDDMAGYRFAQIILFFLAVGLFFVHWLFSVFFGLLCFLFFLLGLARSSAGVELIYSTEGNIYVVKNGCLIWSSAVADITHVDVDSYSPNCRVRGETMIVFYLVGGREYSVFYTNYAVSDLRLLESKIRVLQQRH
jgi:hypothetical protein